jgi:hypothetical protein
MAFEFNGTFTRSQFERFATYVREQGQLIDDRIKHLNAEIARIGDLSFAYDDGGIPSGFANDPPTTYCGKLFGAYEALGGDVEFDLQTRGTGQPVFRLAGDETQAAQMMSNGEVIGVLGLSDAESAILMKKLRGWVSDDLQFRRDALERKIRRAIDYSEQLQQEVAELTKLKQSLDVEGSLEFLLSNMNSLASNRQYMAITDDTAAPDPHGKFAKAPVAAFMPGKQGATATTFERTLDGVAKPGT